MYTTHYTRPHTNSKKEHILSIWLISMLPSPSYPFVSRMMSPVLIASPSLFQTENMILPVLSATLHFLTVLPSLVFCCVPEKNPFIYINIYIYLSQLVGLSLPPIHISCHYCLCFYPPLSITINMQWTFFMPDLRSSIGVILSSAAIQDLERVS